MEHVTEKRLLELTKVKEPYKTIIEIVIKVLPSARQFDYYLSKSELKKFKEILNIKKQACLKHADFFVSFYLNGRYTTIGVMYYRCFQYPLKIERRVYFSSNAFYQAGYKEESDMSEDLETAIRNAYIKYVDRIRKVSDDALSSLAIN